MVDVDLSHALEDYPQTQGQNKYIYLKSHASNTLSSVLGAEIKDDNEMKYGLLERAKLL
jgi:hypothetical protein